MTFEVFSVDRKTLFEFPRSKVHHVAGVACATSALLLCSHYSENGRCARGARCRRVHADVRDAIKASQPHANFVYANENDCIYERFATTPGTVIKVLQPHSKHETESFPLNRILKTAVILAGKQPPVLCAHYFFNRKCTLGSKCKFIHTVSVDPTVQPNACTMACPPHRRGISAMSKKQIQKDFSSPPMAQPTPSNFNAPQPIGNTALPEFLNLLNSVDNTTLQQACTMLMQIKSSKQQAPPSALETQLHLSDERSQPSFSALCPDLPDMPSMSLPHGDSFDMTGSLLSPHGTSSGPMSVRSGSGSDCSDRSNTPKKRRALPAPNRRAKRLVFAE